MRGARPRRRSSTATSRPSGTGSRRSQPSLTGSPFVRQLTQLVERHSAVAFRGLTRVEAVPGPVASRSTRPTASRATPRGWRRPPATASTTGSPRRSPQALPHRRGAPQVVAVARRAPGSGVDRPLRRHARAGPRHRRQPRGASVAVGGCRRPRRRQSSVPGLPAGGVPHARWPARAPRCLRRPRAPGAIPRAALPPSSAVAADPAVGAGARARALRPPIARRRACQPAFSPSPPAPTPQRIAMYRSSSHGVTCTR
jgi:hypothetical protein